MIRRILFLLVLAASLCLHAEDLEALRERAESGDTEAMNYLGYLLLNGTEERQRDVAEGLIWLARAAGAGDVKAASNLGWLYLQGDLVERDYTMAAKWLNKAAEAGLPVAQSMLGDLYRDGQGLPADTMAADSLYRRAFESGLRDAGFKLYELHKETYADLSADEKAATGVYYYLRGAPSEGVKLFYLAAEEGNPRALALLGDAYTRAVGVPYDYNLSLKYYAEGARAGNPSAQFILGELLEIFPDALKGLPDSELNALPPDPQYWFEKAACNGITDADLAEKALLAED